jgi:hypothetical protein
VLVIETFYSGRRAMWERVAERIRRLIELIVQAGGFGSVTVVIEKGRVARIVWSVDEKVTEPKD